MNQFTTIAADIVAIAVLTFGLYFPRHHRRDLVVAFLAVNIGVLAVATALGSSTVTAGGDGVKSDNDEDADAGYVSVTGGTVDVTASVEGLEAAHVAVSGGDVPVVASATTE